MQELKAREDAKRQDADLDKACYELLSQEEREQAEEDWDPMEYLVEKKRGTYVDLIGHFLFMPQSTPYTSDVDVPRTTGEDQHGNSTSGLTSTSKGASASSSVKSANSVGKTKKKLANR